MRARVWVHCSDSDSNTNYTEAPKLQKLYLVNPFCKTVLTLPAPPRSEDTGKTVALVSRAGVSAPAACSHIALVLTRSAHSTYHVHARTLHTAEELV